MTLPTHPLGNSGMHVTRVGFGSWAVRGGGWSFGRGPQDDAESLATMRHALELGINRIDTATIYGLGHFEEIGVSGAIVGARTLTQVDGCKREVA